MASKEKRAGVRYLGGRGGRGDVAKRGGRESRRETKRDEARGDVGDGGERRPWEERRRRSEKAMQAVVVVGYASIGY